MFVRNKMYCPNCGKSNIFDVCVHTDFIGGDYWEYCKMHFECISCSHGFSTTLSANTFAEILDDVVEHTTSSGAYRALHQAYHRTKGTFDSIRTLMNAEMTYCEVACHIMFVSNRNDSDLLDLDSLSRTVQFFLESPNRKRRFKPEHLLRSVGL
jgi:hypothetical protein